MIKYTFHPFLLVVILLFLQLVPVQTFVIVARSNTASTTALYWFFDKTFHGRGSAASDGKDETELDQIYRTQLEILKARQEQGETKDQLKVKYRNPPKSFHVKAEDAYKNRYSNQFDGHEMYVETGNKKQKQKPVSIMKKKDSPAQVASGGKPRDMSAFKMPWDK